MIEKEFTIIEPKASMGSIMLTSFILTVYIGLSYLFLTNTNALNFYRALVLIIIQGFVVFKFMVIPYIIRRSTHINFKKKMIKTGFGFGPLTFSGKWKKLKNLEYIAVFRIDDSYQVNLWYQQRKTLNLFILFDLIEAFKNAFKIAEKLGIDLVDASEKGQNNRIDMQHYKEKGEIRHQ